MNSPLYVLASKSPRRHALLQRLGLDFRIEDPDIQEVIPSYITDYERVVFLSNKKAMHIRLLDAKEIVIAADTMVIFEGKEFGKPKDEKEAIDILKALSGKEHEVVTGVTLRSNQDTHSFYCISRVLFGDLSADSISEYIKKYEPFDKAGSYGIQDCLGENGEKTGPLDMWLTKGSYSNVLGLPVDQLEKELKHFTDL
jgi:septum formation protein